MNIRPKPPHHQFIGATDAATYCSLATCRQHYSEPIHHGRGITCECHPQPAPNDPRSTSRPAEISGSKLCSRQPCEWYTSHPSGVCDGCRQPAANDQEAR